jgi:D-alanyl-lipoteichoic acid acyltransferase DltB (MBOAT superfamily)
MSEATIDLIGWPFWIALAAGILLLTPLTRGTPRRAVQAVLNLAFLIGLLQLSAVVVLASVTILWLVFRAIERRVPGVWILAAMATGALFVLHKLPADLPGLGPGVNPVLAAVSFSYVALRIVEVVRAVHEGRHPAPTWIETVDYLLPFHMLPAGPIQSYDDFRAAPAVPAPLTPRAALEGTERIVLGLLKKYVLAYALERSVLTGFHSTGWYFFLEMQAFHLWLFLDFTAYSDIAVGAGRLLGVATPENFRRPLLARNMIQFWERWHITLSLFIRRHLFIPIQLFLVRRIGGHRPLLAASIAFAVSFLLCGLWHAFSWQFLAWGAFHALGLILCNLYGSWLQKRWRRKGMKRYLADWRSRVPATILTYQWVACSLVFIAYPWKEVAP